MGHIPLMLLNHSLADSADSQITESKSSVRFFPSSDLLGIKGDVACRVRIARQSGNEAQLYSKPTIYLLHWLSLFGSHIPNFWMQE